MTVENNGKTLQIKNVQLNDEGSYVCVAANGVGTPATHSVSLQVYGKLPTSSNNYNGCFYRINISQQKTSKMSAIN